MQSASPRSLVVSLGPLALTVLVLLALLGVDVAVNSAVNRETALVAGNALKSLELVSEMRGALRRLSTQNLPTAEQLGLVRQLTDAGERYHPLAEFAGERPDWERLKAAISGLHAAILRGESERIVAEEKAVYSSIDRLARSNHAQVGTSNERIRTLGLRATLADAVAVALAIGLVVWIGVRQLRAAARERALLARNVTLVEERNRELDLFASRVAHDLRAPLNPIRGFADLIIMGDEPADDVRQLATRIRAGADRMLRVIEDMLELSRFGRPVPGRASVPDVCRSVLEEMGQSLSAAKVSTELAPLVVGCSPSLLGQILRNLVENALKFRATTRPLAIEIVAKVADEQAVIEVSDNGVGVDPESAKHVFEPYFRARGDVAGHGLGLAIVDRAVRSLGGSCELSSNVGEGARVTIRLPRVAGDEASHV
jgi:signal transduction histidine kinase